MTNRRWLKAGLVILSVSLVACARHERAVVTVGPTRIDLQQAQQFLNDHPEEGDPRAGLEALARREQMALWGDHQKQVAKPLAELAALEEGLLKEALLRQEYPTALQVNDDKLWEAYRRMEGERNVRHVLCADKETGELAKTMLGAGTPFEKVARQYSKDGATASRGGNLGWVRPKDLDPALSARLTKLPPRTVDGPTKTSSGYELVEVLEMRDPPRAPFERDKAAFSDQYKREVVQELEHVILRTKGASVKVELNEKFLEDDAPSLDVHPGDDQKIVAVIPEGAKVSLADLKGFMRSSFPYQGESHTLGPAVKKQFLGLMLDQQKLVVLAKRAGIESSDRFKLYRWDKSQDMLAGWARWVFVNAYEPKDQELVAYFQARKETLAANPESRLAVLALNDPGLAASLSSFLMSHPEQFAEYVRRSSVDEQTRDQGGDIGWVGMASLSRLVDEDSARSILKAKAGSVAGPFDTSYGRILVKVLEVRPGKPLELSEIRAEVVKAFRRTEWQGIVRGWSTELDRDYPYDIDRTSVTSLTAGHKAGAP